MNDESCIFTFLITNGLRDIIQKTYEPGRRSDEERWNPAAALRKYFTLLKATIEENPKRFLTHENEWVRRYARKLIEEKENEH